ncbi:MAG: metallophosphoesterase [Deltaproteobacteria bacterium]|jgi:putative phosphoesterase|nr:metallophosphoesterase [Deltaproteobacteria bacterium]
MITIGVLSDTHLLEPDERFRKKIKRCFADVDMILHAGDLTSLSILDAFNPKKVHAVHGNMCGPKTRAALPASKIITVNGFRIALFHGAGYMHNTEERLFDAFGPIDCIVYGHTHKPVCHLYGSTLMVNPGSFTATGTYGASGTYAIITVDQAGIKGRIHSVENVS